ncbi:MAG: hypothetical protein ABSH34_11565 [Verrucomicrobiota bacterium]
MMQFKPIPTLAALLLTPLAALHAAMPDFQSQYLAVGLSRSTPAFSVFAVDSLGQGKLGQNPVLAETNAVPGLELEGGFTYKLNMFQVNPRLQMLANNASSDACSFTLFEYSDVALHAPPTRRRS